MAATSKLVVLAAGVAVFLTSCAVKGTPTWPGARLNAAALSAEDFPPGVEFDRIAEQPGQPDGTNRPPPMASEPAGCTDGLTRDIAASVDRGPGSSVKYAVTYDGARVVMTVLADTLDLNRLDATATRCEAYTTFFDAESQPIQMTTTKMSSQRPQALTYRQTMQLRGTESSVYFTFENVGDSGMFGIAFPTPNPAIAVKASLPQTFLEITARQAQRLG
ncbi:hypothetical protein H7K45_22820 [Mycobacterium yunnanensis]|uniref:DUF5642 domain-containing protein n=1 Tax=Mycobacterium yunnanensis TaxID=368477 RepID=A0A9X2Z6V2_9MYCO|nr:hypothetical protein [Mycobacterium yunnanensis]MCV7423391.1 hypothetical protein [Mycobacterium yunnanensis]